MNRRSSPKRRTAGRSRPWWAVAPWVLVAVFAALAFSARRVVSRDTPAALAPDKRVAVAPNLSLTTLQGEYQLAEQRGEVVALYFSFVG